MSAVLVVDDDPVALAMARDVLAAAGFPTHTATDWATMNDVLGDHPVSAILLDVNLPGLKGDVVAEILARTRNPAPKIILHSAIEAAELRRKAHKVGAASYLCKGATEDSMVRTVRAAVTAHQTALAGAGSAPRSVVPARAGGTAPPRPGALGAPREDLLARLPRGDRGEREG